MSVIIFILPLIAMTSLWLVSLGKITAATAFFLCLPVWILNPLLMVFFLIKFIIKGQVKDVKFWMIWILSIVFMAISIKMSRVL